MTTKFFVLKQDLFKCILPHGIPRNNLVILAGEGGSGKSVIITHIVKDALSSGEPVVYVTVDDDPQTVLMQLESFGVDTNKVCSDKQLILVDGFSYILKTTKPHFCVEEEVQVEEPDKFLSILTRVVEKHGLSENGLLVIDSLNDLFIQMDPTRLILFIKSLRAIFAKSRSILTIATLHTSTESFKEYLASIEHLVDGILETSNIHPQLAQAIPIFVRQITVRKMKGVDSKQGYVLYGIDHEGLKPVVLQLTK